MAWIVDESGRVLSRFNKKNFNGEQIMHVACKLLTRAKNHSSTTQRHGYFVNIFFALNPFLSTETSATTKSTKATHVEELSN